MRVILVGPLKARERLRQALADSPAVEIVGEATSPAEARAGAVGVEAFVTAVSRSAAGADVMAEPLTPRELAVLRWLAEGLPNKAIALRLGISDQTVKFHVASICGKLGAQNRTGAVRLAIERGLVTV